PAIRFGQERTVGGYFDNIEWAEFFTLRYQFEWYKYPTLLEAGLVYYTQSYTNPGAQLALNLVNNAVRFDGNASQTLRIVQPLTEYVGLEFRYRHSTNASNINGFSYESDVF